MDAELSVIDRAKTFKIRTNDDAQNAAAFMLDLKLLEKQIRENQDPAVEAAHASHKAALVARDEHLKPVLDAMKQLRNAQSGFAMEQGRLRQLEQIRLNKLAEDEAKEKRKEEIAAERAAGNKEAVKELKAAPLHVAPAVALPVFTISGQSVANSWDFEVIDESLIPREYLSVNEKAIRARVKSLRSKSGLPGIRIFETATVSTRLK